MKQFNNVNSSRGAPMGRPNALALDNTPKSIQLFRVGLCSQGYDDGGAYWGLGQSLWCARDYSGNEQFVRASSRITAAAALEIPNHSLLRGFSQDDMNSYFRSFVEGRMPPSLLEAADWEWWFEMNGYTIFDGSAKHAESISL